MCIRDRQQLLLFRSLTLWLSSDCSGSCSVCNKGSVFVSWAKPERCTRVLRDPETSLSARRSRASGIHLGGL
eukprot:3505103-Rhodomonas_salina.1